MRKNEMRKKLRVNKRKRDKSKTIREKYNSTPQSITFTYIKHCVCNLYIIPILFFTVC